MVKFMLKQLLVHQVNSAGKKSICCCSYRGYRWFYFENKGDQKVNLLEYQPELWLKALTGCAPSSVKLWWVNTLTVVNIKSCLTCCVRVIYIRLNLKTLRAYSKHRVPPLQENLMWSHAPRPWEVDKSYLPISVRMYYHRSKTPQSTEQQFYIHVILHIIFMTFNTHLLFVSTT